MEKIKYLTASMLSEQSFLYLNADFGVKKKKKKKTFKLVTIKLIYGRGLDNSCISSLNFGNT